MNREGLHNGEKKYSKEFVDGGEILDNMLKEHNLRGVEEGDIALDALKELDALEAGVSGFQDLLDGIETGFQEQSFQVQENKPEKSKPDGFDIHSISIADISSDRIEKAVIGGKTRDADKTGSIAGIVGPKRLRKLAA